MTKTNGPCQLRIIVRHAKAEYAKHIVFSLRKSKPPHRSVLFHFLLIYMRSTLNMLISTKKKNTSFHFPLQTLTITQDKTINLSCY